VRVCPADRRPDRDTVCPCFTLAVNSTHTTRSSRRPCFISSVSLYVSRLQHRPVSEAHGALAVCSIGRTFWPVAWPAHREPPAASHRASGWPAAGSPLTIDGAGDVRARGVARVPRRIIFGRRKKTRLLHANLFFFSACCLPNH
jgi:hypothetical protein